MMVISLRSSTNATVILINDKQIGRGGLAHITENDRFHNIHFNYLNKFIKKALSVIRDIDLFRKLTSKFDVNKFSSSFEFLLCAICPNKFKVKMQIVDYGYFRNI